MEAVSCSAAVTAPILSAKPLKIPPSKSPALHLKATPRCSPISCFSSSVSAAATPNSAYSPSHSRRHWMVLMETPPQEFTTRPQAIDYYVNVLERVLGCKEDAQRCMYDASSDTHLGFCCDVDEETANELAGRPEVLLVKPDPDFDSVQKDYSSLNNGFLLQSTNFCGNTSLLFPAGTTKHWLVRMDRPAVGAVRKAQVVDYNTQVLMRVLGNEKDAQMCMYHVSWQSNYGFCCELDNECAQELAGIPGVLSVKPDDNFGSDDKDYSGESGAMEDPSASLTTKIKTKKLFVTGLSFYTSEKTLSEAFAGFGELVEVKVIMDKISKRSKGYAFVEYKTEEAASTALREMNGKIINGWMITVDVAKKSPVKYSHGNPRPASRS